MTRKIAWIAMAVALGAAGLGSCSNGGPMEPRVANGMWMEGAGVGPYFPSPDGEQVMFLEGASWCVADLPTPEGVDAVLPVTMGVLPSGTWAVRCSDSLVVTSPFWSPDGSRIAALGQESTPQLYVLDPASLEIETILDNAGWPAAWVSESEILYYGGEPAPTWQVAPVDGESPRTISAPRPAASAPVLVDDSRVVYRTDRPRAGANPGAVEVADLIELDWRSGTATELAALNNLNPGGGIADPGLVSDVTSDLGYAVLFAATKANESGEGPTAYVYDLEGGALIEHTAPDSTLQSLGTRPFLVGDAWIAYSALASGDSGPLLNVYLAPLDDPSAAVVLFEDGLLVDAQNDRLFIAMPSGEGIVFLDLDF